MENLANRRQMADQAAGTNGSAALASEDFGTSQIGIVDTPVHRPLCCMAKTGCARKNKKKKTQLQYRKYCTLSVSTSDRGA